MARRRLDAVAEALGDGNRVDWTTLEHQSHPGERAGLRQLRSLVELTGYPSPRRGALPQPRSDFRVPIFWAVVSLVAATQALFALGRFAGVLWTGDVPFPLFLQGSAVVCLLVCASVLVQIRARPTRGESRHPSGVACLWRKPAVPSIGSDLSRRVSAGRSVAIRARFPARYCALRGSMRGQTSRLA